MKVEVRGRAITVTDHVRARIERRLGFALERFNSRLKSALVWLGDMSGSRGGSKKCCRLAVILATGGAVVVEETDSNLSVAIDRAADRAGAKVSRELKRIRDFRRTATRAEVTMVASAAA